MAIKTTDDCCGCAECIHCGRDKLRFGAFCDICEEEIGDTVYFLDGLTVCRDCLLEEAPHQDVNDFLEV